MEEDEDVEERGLQFVSENFQFRIVVDHGYDVLLKHHEAFAGQPYDVEDELERLGVADGIRSTLFFSLDELLREANGQAQDFEEHGGE